MNLLQWRKKEYALWHDWYVRLETEYERIDNGDSVQLCNEDGSRVIYGSSFVVGGVDNVKDEVHYMDMKNNDNGSYSLAASVSQNNEFLTIAITYTDPSDEKWARAVIESARRV